ncbi:sulfite exporter TauE/SafE family protein [Ostreibacterium oceani]|nr:sulfite exporter TauE/SafE family protein [Ostreibacterium oceani]
MTITELPLLLTTFVIGLLGSSHCIGMCGGLQQLLLQIGPKQTRIAPIYLYNLGRLSSYLCIAFLSALLLNRFAEQTAGLIPYANSVRLLAAFIMLYLGVGYFVRFPKLRFFTQPAQALWRRLRQFAAPWMPPKNLYQVYAIGLIWGWIPCSLVYSALAVSLSAPTTLLSVIAMACFGLGTMPTLIGIGLLSNHLQRLKKYRALLALLLILLGCYSLLSFVF